MDPIKLAHLVEDRYRRYLKTTFYFRDPILRDSFEKQLESGTLRKGPYLEATPVFKRSTTVQDLFGQVLGSQIDTGFIDALHKETPSLYKHQDDAIRKVSDGKNIIVATGTGSGKTESFLYPILADLYQELQLGTLRNPGVRALILYPMNALANDQRERLGELCKMLKENKSQFRFTFGQYIGETPEDERDSYRRANDHLMDRKNKGFTTIENGIVTHGEFVLRSEMRKHPPHILLTNYSMLEYLLLRPDDSPLFDNGRAQQWKFLVLDEVHQYRGTQGMEMGMLLRRLKQRLQEGGRINPFLCIATSASLVGGQSDKKAVAKFAMNLFGEKFYEEDVVLGETEPIPQTGNYLLDLEEYEILKNAQQPNSPQGNKQLEQLASRKAILFNRNDDIPKIVGHILSQDSRTTLLRNLITPSSTMENGNSNNNWRVPLVEDVAKKVFTEEIVQDKVKALSDLINLLLQAKNPSSHYDAPLVSARYHLFIRSLEGAYAFYGVKGLATLSWPQRKVFLDRGDNIGKFATFEVALCRECGQHYFVGKIVNGKFVEAIRDPGNPSFGATYLRPIENEAEEIENEKEGEDSLQKLMLCLVCGQVSERALTCTHNNSVRVLKEEEVDDDDRKDQIKKCSVCGYNASGKDPVREIIYGTDGPHAVIATTLFQSLPEGRKKVLAFADGRQEAAYFAWYLEDTYKDILSRNLILKVIRGFKNYPTEGLSFMSLANRMYRDFGDAFKIKASDDILRIKRNIWRSLYREFLTEERRISLEGVGLIRWSIVLPDTDIFSKSPWLLIDREIKDIVFTLLNSMRLNRAVDLVVEEDVSLKWDELNLQATQLSFRVGIPGSKYVRSWDGTTSSGHISRNQRITFLTKLLKKKGIKEDKADQEAISALRSLWEYLTSNGTNDQLLSLASGDSRWLNPNWWRLHPCQENDVIFQCNTCERIQSVSVENLCSNQRCSGTLVARDLSSLKANHYRDLYREELPSNLRVEEHTAQLDHEKAREFQKDFRNGKIHVLSCSTTFELGVDLGSLDSVFLRNVPPESFNYIQRVGRAGRRRGFPGFAITYSRKNPHDLYHFAEPQRMLSGYVKPPILTIQNQKIIARHLTALVLSKFLRQNPHRYKGQGDSKSRIERLFVNLESPSAVSDFRGFIIQNRDNLEKSINTILKEIDQATIEELGINNGRWIDEISGSESRLKWAQDIVSDDYKRARKHEKDMLNQRDYDRAKWAKKRAETIAGDEVISFLSRTAVIPKYGFPVDVVELDTQRIQSGEAIALQRDLSIAVAEFAPSSELIANKKVWVSYGLKKVAGKEWDRWWYGRCKLHNVFVRGKSNNEVSDQKCCQNMVISEYIDPQFGFVTNLEKPKVPKGRTGRVFTIRPYFAEFKKQGEEKLLREILTFRTASPAFMVVLCEGRRSEGFYVCGDCGAAFKSWDKCKKGHETPFGKKCSTPVESLRPPVSLGHEFITDAIQLQFHPKPEIDGEIIWFGYSLGYAILVGASEILDIPLNNLNATVASGSDLNILPPIILYDDVPGGAGLVAQLEDFETLKQCLHKALDRVANCTGCTEKSSCYSCLRSYRNQFAHQHLQRGPVAKYLNQILSQWLLYAQ